jgi:hypothetical protein
LLILGLFALVGYNNLISCLVPHLYVTVTELLNYIRIKLESTSSLLSPNKSTAFNSINFYISDVLVENILLTPSNIHPS